MHELTVAQAAYIAGLVDGEGTISLIKARKHRDDWYFPDVSIANTNFEMIRWLLVATGTGNDYTFVHTNHWKDYRMWKVPTAIMVQFLIAIKPYLVIKEYQAELLLEYFEKCHIPIHAKGKDKEITEENHVLRMVLYDLLRAENKKGKK